MWRNVRIAILLVVLLWAAAHTWIERVTSTRWREPLWVGIFPINADGSQAAQSYIDALDASTFSDISEFVAREAHRYGRELSEPVHIELYPQVRRIPPLLVPGAGVLDIASWSLRLRWFGWRQLEFNGRAPPRIRMLVLYHDASTLDSVPDSHGLQKGLIGVVHLFALRKQEGTNAVVLAHELLHTLGATDKYVPGTGFPVFPSGFADPYQKPLYPQAMTEIMAGRYAVSAQDARMPVNLKTAVVGPQTAAEIRWTRQ